ncbi:MAG: hypothetical protein JWM34_3396 [Ilumatobacteraceae bacterium]|nr:hypothetical protein [Ilumatobacteraceae bacterium]
MKKILGWTVAAVVSLGGVAACSSDSKSTSTTKAATTATTAAGATAGSTSTGGDSNTATVDKFCKDVADLVANGPAASDYASKLTALTGQGSTLAAAVAADPSLQTKLTDCLKKLVP